MSSQMGNDVRNIMLNLSGGLLPEHLTQDEVNTLETFYGSEWFFRLGYSEKRFKKPIFNKKEDSDG